MSKVKCLMIGMEILDFRLQLEVNSQSIDCKHVGYKIKLGKLNKNIKVKELQTNQCNDIYL